MDNCPDVRIPGAEPDGVDKMVEPKVTAMVDNSSTPPTVWEKWQETGCINVVGQPDGGIKEDIKRWSTDANV